MFAKFGRFFIDILFGDVYLFIALVKYNLIVQ